MRLVSDPFSPVTVGHTTPRETLRLAFFFPLALSLASLVFSLATAVMALPIFLVSTSLRGTTAILAISSAKAEYKGLSCSRSKITAETCWASLMKSSLVLGSAFVRSAASTRRGPEMFRSLALILWVFHKYSPRTHLLARRRPRNPQRQRPRPLPAEPFPASSSLAGSHRP